MQLICLLMILLLLPIPLVALIEHICNKNHQGPLKGKLRTSQTSSHSMIMLLKCICISILSFTDNMQSNTSLMLLQQLEPTKLQYLCGLVFGQTLESLIPIWCPVVKELKWSCVKTEFQSKWARQFDTAGDSTMVEQWTPIAWKQRKRNPRWSFFKGHQ